jgi:hypothetical protein
MIFVVKSVQVPELVKQLERGKKISRESVVRESESCKYLDVMTY